MFDIIIIGGGAAGLMAAKILSARGKKTLLLEAKDRLGGRIYTTSEGFSFKAEAGAEFIHGNLTTTLHLLKQARLEYAEVGGEIFRVENGEWKLQNDFIEDWDLLIYCLGNLKKDITVSAFLEQNFSGKKYNDLRNSFTGYVEGYDAADINFTSSFAIREEMKKEEDENFRINNCYGSLINFLEDECRKNNCIIKISEPVTKINWYLNNVEVITTTAKYKGCKVVVTIPVGVLQCHENEWGAIKFSPAISAQTEAAKQIGFGNVIKILMEFDKAFWLENKFSGKNNSAKPSYIFADTFIPTWWSQYPSEIPLLTGWMAGSKLKHYKDISEEEILQHSIASLATIFNYKPDVIKRKLKHHKIINWIHDPFSKGGYSYPTLTTKKARRVLQSPVKNTIYFAGEALAQNSTATVDAALSSGKEVAEAIYGEL